jgi:Uma2 family endonuclease
MTAHALMYVDKPTFYRFVVNADEQHRYEYVRGWIMQQQAGGTFKHARLGARFVTLMSSLLAPSVWAVSGSDRLIDLSGTVRFADAVVERIGTAADDSLQTEHPVVIVEVLSPSSEERDLSVKPLEYLRAHTLDTYIVASQDEVLCYVWQRRADGTFAEAAEVIKGRDKVVTIPGLGIAIALGEVYRGIEI